tara:strand:- start:932 stop:1567 length:636 start_codon:yes stop_codon:yes gene_type:complete
MSAKAKFVYKKPFDTHETYGIKKPIKFNQVYGNKYGLIDPNFIQAFRDYDFYESRDGKDNEIYASYKDLINTFGKPVKITKEIEKGTALFHIDNKAWTMDVVWYVLLNDQRIKGKKVDVPVIIYNTMNGKNYCRNYEEQKKIQTTYGDEIDNTLVADFERRYPLSQHTTKNTSEIKHWNISVGTKWNEDYSILRSKFKNKIYLENLIMEYK